MFELKVFTLNIWGIPIVSRNRESRVQAIADHLAFGDYDVVCLQEVWSYSDYNYLLSRTANVLPYAHYFRSGVLGSGICILSKHIIRDTFFHQWSVNGYMHKIQHADWFGGKGVGLCRIQVYDYMINVYSAHFHAEYNRESDEYRAHRVLQAFDTAQFVRITSGDVHGIILAGDLNTQPNDLEYRILLGTVNLHDAFLSVPNVSSNEISTCEAAKNSYTSRVARKNNLGQRIDYVLYKAGPLLRKFQINAVKYCQPLSDCVPNKTFSFSDHEAVHVVLKIDSSSTDRYATKITEVELVAALAEGLEVCRASLGPLRRRRILYFCGAALCVLFLVAASFIPVNYIYKEVISAFKVFCSFVLFFTLLMATLWDQIERNATLAGIEGIDRHLKNVSDNGSVTATESIISNHSIEL